MWYYCGIGNNSDIGVIDYIFNDNDPDNCIVNANDSDYYDYCYYSYCYHRHCHHYWEIGRAAMRSISSLGAIWLQLVFSFRWLLRSWALRSFEPIRSLDTFCKVRSVRSCCVGWGACWRSRGRSRAGSVVLFAALGATGRAVGGGRRRLTGCSRDRQESCYWTAAHVCRRLRGDVISRDCPNRGERGARGRGM